MNRTAKPGEINHATFDRFTIGHAAIGALMGLSRVPPGWAAAVAIGWEIVERPLKNALPSMFPHSTQDTPQNAVADALAMLAAYWFIRSLPPK